MAEGLLRHHLAAAGVDAHVHSAGLVTQDQPASEHGVDAMARRGIDIAGHRSRRLAAELVGPADLVVAMELQHVREVAVLDMAAFPRTFTLPELARRLRAIGPRPASVAVADHLARAGAGRRTADLLGRRPDDEVADPIGRPARDYERTASQLEELVRVVVEHLFPSTPQEH
jgi:protein-tyrosine phosphatase